MCNQQKYKMKASHHKIFFFFKMKKYNIQAASMPPTFNHLILNQCVCFKNKATTILFMFLVKGGLSVWSQSIPSKQQ